MIGILAAWSDVLVFDETTAENATRNASACRAAKEEITTTVRRSVVAVILKPGEAVLREMLGCLAVGAAEVMVVLCGAW